MWLQSPRERPAGFEFLSPRENLKAVLPPSENAQEERLTVRNLLLSSRKGGQVREHLVTSVSPASSAEIDAME